MFLRITRILRIQFWSQSSGVHTWTVVVIHDMILNNKKKQKSGVFLASEIEKNEQ